MMTDRIPGIESRLTTLEARMTRLEADQEDHHRDNSRRLASIERTLYQVAAAAHLLTALYRFAVPFIGIAAGWIGHAYFPVIR